MKSWRWYGVSIIIVAFLTGLYLLYLARRDSGESQPSGNKASINQGVEKVASVTANVSRIGSNSVTAVTNGRSGYAVSEKSMTNAYVTVDVMTNALVNWIFRKEGKVVRVIDAQMVRTYDGKPAMLNVIVSARTGEIVNINQVKKLLSEKQKDWDSVRTQMGESYKQQNVQKFNSAAGELTKNKEDFMKGLEVETYKLSLSKDNPPVVAFWGGLPVEVLNEGIALTKAFSILGEGTQLTGLIAYTPMSSLLWFKNADGNAAYVDPINIILVAEERLKSERPKFSRQDDGRNDRVAKQWQTFFQ